MSDLILWGSLVVIIASLAATVVIGRRTLKGPRYRLGSDPALADLVSELKRSNDLLERTLTDHAFRLARLEAESAERAGPGGEEPDAGES
ncbi:MAG: hypothetical protein KDI98_07970 [Hyphomicrobiaceae bacterium]|nr:hypothetical protein [Hyphomicrobiaceae bacterium]